MKPNMDLTWESNSRVKNLVGRCIYAEDIIPRCKTMDFPTDAATVRLARVREKNPHVVIHIRGKGQQKSYPYWDYQSNTQNYQTYTHANTLRLGFTAGKPEKGFYTNGEMDFMNLPQLCAVVDEVKGVLENA